MASSSFSCTTVTMTLYPNDAGASGNGGDNKPVREDASVEVPAMDHKEEDKKDEDLSEEDLELKQQLELYVEHVQDADLSLQTCALESIRQEIQTATSSMTSVPKPLKFLRPHYGTLKSHYEKMSDSGAKKLMADILSVLALTMSAKGERESLKYRLLGSYGDIGSWGHEYVTNLGGEVAQEYRQTEDDDLVDDLMKLKQQIVAFHMKHNAEPEAVDLLMELTPVEDLGTVLESSLDSANYKRTCSYLLSVANYLAEPDDLLVFDIVYLIYRRFKQYESALFIALRLDNLAYVRKIFMLCDNLLRKKQLCCILAHHRKTFVLDEDMCSEEDLERLQFIIGNNKLIEGYLTLARDIDVMEPKTPEDIYKCTNAHLVDDLGVAGTIVLSARQNLAATYVNAFVNAGFGQDKLMTVPSEASGDSSTSWLFKNKGHGKASAVACLGMIMLWDVEIGLAQIDKYFHSTDTHVVAGALLAVGIVNCTVKNDHDSALVLLAEYVVKEDPSIRVGAIIGFGLAYAGSQHYQVFAKLRPILVENTNASLDVIAFTVITLGLVFLGSCNEEIAQAIRFSLKNRSESELGEPLARLLPLGLGLLYLGKQDSVDETAEISNAFGEKISRHCDMTLLSCAYAGTGNVEKVQEFLGECAEHLEKGETYQGPAVLGIAMVAMTEELGLEMAIRSLEHLLQYGEQNIRRAVPLALGLLRISNPKVNVTDTLSRLSHDSDTEVAMAAIISLGLIGAGTNNARIAGMLHNLSSYYYKESDLLFCVQIAQGLVHLGKGLLTLSPYHSERFLFSQTALAGLIVTLHACLDMKALILGEYHYLLYFLSLAMMPRMLMTVDENLKPLSVPVRVGQAVGVVDQPGRPKTITGFRTYSTPVLLSAGDQAELATDKYIPLSPVLEGFVILKENPEYKDDH
ncbi:26S proteasome non-ATPase regulatory subunit 2 homolog A-like [Ipomoea triloba]|uniref:26S proteasome non-ATPase regulatory subunit 2 homolog A-like n=1 Tax=Ipomoea triloba TaxID=35885 RepID=UPI00125E79D5|nr:26S proteasome non-ATPase regulatory subunit 2 homolog A-like [Ipomoea triloba]